MRADRLVAVLLLVQAKGRVTANEVATELEISERTARRDLEALAMAGIPIYSQAGRGGGWSLVGGARTDLTGLTAPEAQALFTMAGTAGDVTPALRSALRKLTEALPETFRDTVERAADSTLIDPASWGRSARQYQPPLLASVRETVVAGTRAQMDYVRADGTASQRTIDPLGVVAKGRNWYLVALTDQGQRTFRVDRIQAFEPLDEPAERPSDFNLQDAWNDITDAVEQQRRREQVHGFADPEVVGWLRGAFGEDLTVGEANDDGEIAITLWATVAERVVYTLAGFGSRVRITSPPEVQVALADIGRELVDAYTSPG